MIKSMNTLRTHGDSAQFGLTEYSDMTHAEFIAAKLNRNTISATVMDRRLNSIPKERDDHWKTPMPQNIIRYARSTIWNMGSLPKKVDWYVQMDFVFKRKTFVISYCKEGTWCRIESAKSRSVRRLLGT